LAGAAFFAAGFAFFKSFWAIFFAGTPRTLCLFAHRCQLRHAWKVVNAHLWFRLTHRFT
jgi:hypothetical protein